MPATDPVVSQVEPDPAKPYAAYVSAFLTLVAMVVFAWLTDDTPKKHPDFTMDELKDTVLAALLASGLVGGGTFAVKKPLRRKTGGRHEAGQSPVVTALLILAALLLLVFLVRVLT